MDDDVTAALAQIKRAAAAHARAQKREEQTRAELHTAIVEAFRHGARPVEVDEVSPYDRNHNGRIRAAADIPGVREQKKAAEQ
jgi:hypothetical protein